MTPQDRNRVRWLALGGVIGLAWFFWKIPLDPVLWDTWIAMKQRGGSIALVNGRGYTKVLFHASGALRYGSPFSWKERGFGAVRTTNRRNATIVYQDIDTGSSGSLMASASSWVGISASPSGRKFAFVPLEEHRTVSVYEEGAEGTELFQKKYLQEKTSVEAIGWATEHSLVVVVEKFTEKNGYMDHVYLVNIENGNEELLCVMKDVFLDSQRWLYSRSASKAPLCNGRKEIAAIVGSSEHPTRSLLPSTDKDGRYQFYAEHRYSPILGYHKWIEGYDRKTGRTFTVKTLQWFGSGEKSTLFR